MAASYTVLAFIEDARAIMDAGGKLEDQQAVLGERLSELSARHGFTRVGLPLGPSDASTENFLLWREPPSSPLCWGSSTRYKSPVHEPVSTGSLVAGTGARTGGIDTCGSEPAESAPPSPEGTLPLR
jgi:hypothetical protein